jgi:hypothetical protein
MTQRFYTLHGRGGRALLLAALVLVSPPASAQVPAETSGGARALGMGGAFTAVADDATATWWNAAGLPSLLADAVLDAGADSLVDNAEAPLPAGGAWRARPFAVAVALPVLGVAFNHLIVHEIRPSTGTAEPGRQDPPARVRNVDLSSVGLSLAQSLGDFVVVGGTVRLLHGGLGSAYGVAGTTVDTALDSAGALETRDRTVVDADLAVMAFAGPVRLALSGRNLAAHDFESGLAGDEPFRLERHVRAGIALGTGPAWVRRAWTLACDADLTTVHAADGERRSLAFGAERWLGAHRRMALRGGGRIQTVGAARPAVSGGASVAVKTGVFVEAHVTGGGDRATHGWGVAGRVTF